MKEIKWYIFNKNDEPLCWEYEDWDKERLIEFENLSEISEFIKFISNDFPDFDFSKIIIKSAIMYYNNGYTNFNEIKKLKEKLDCK